MAKRKFQPKVAAPTFILTDRQRQALRMLAGNQTHQMLYGGSRSGKTFLLVRAICYRALVAPRSRHAILRYRFNHVKASVVMDTFPKVMELCYPQVHYDLDKTDWFVTFPNGSEIWFGGLDEKERSEKILGNEYVTILLNECSQIPYSSRNLALTRLAQMVEYEQDGKRGIMRPKMWYDENPPNKGHWTYQLFFAGRDPEDKKKEINRADYAQMKMSPEDNVVNLPSGYMETLDSLPARLRLRFKHGEFSEVAPNALWTLEGIETYRTIGELPDMVRIVIAVDPSGTEGQEKTPGADPVGIIVAGLGTDGNGYVLEDLTCNVAPAVWGKVVATAFDRHLADRVVGEKNFGGAMVEHTVQTARRRTPYSNVIASRGKAVRAEPISALAETGRIRHAGYFPDLEDQLCNFLKGAYVGSESPNNADAYVWAFTELFAQIVQGPREPKKIKKRIFSRGAHSWLGA